MPSSKTYNFSKGRQGEVEARKYLELKGFKFIEANYKNKIGEIDLIMKDGNCLVFVEVKLKIGDRNGIPEDMIDKRKISRVRKTAEYYCAQMGQNIYNQLYRIDAVCIVKKFNNDIDRINHYLNLY